VTPDRRMVGFTKNYDDNISRITTRSEMIGAIKRSFSNKTVQHDELAAGNSVF